MGQSLSPPPTRQLSLFSTPIPWLSAFWKFSRPHTIIGTSLSVIGVFAIAWAVVRSAPPAVPPAVNPFSLLLPLIACLSGNVYIVGLNQIQDVDIDRINKPRLPIASGEFSRQDGWWIVSFAGLIAVVLAGLGGWFLLATVLLSLAIGTAYSLPPIRLKRFPFWASVCILTVRGAVVNLGLFLHYSEQLGLPLRIPAAIWGLTGFVLVFSVVIAIFKDIPDIEGDRRYNISTFTVQLGQQRVFNLARWILTACYLGIAIASPWIPGLNGPFLLISHGAIVALFWWRSQRVAWADSPQDGATHSSDQADGAVAAPALTFAAFYQFIWQLFFLEYLLYPVACWLGH
jgi:homogentisate phytyltransferase/homogentisate geranylgeranyltransferase